MKRIAIFASGTGSNAKKIVEHFKGKSVAMVAMVISNNVEAPVLAMAAQNGIKTLVVNRKGFYAEQSILAELAAQQIDFIVLAGFLWLVPVVIVEKYPNAIVNIHPALLPKYGGKGMYGMKVHRAVREANETETGITIHFVNQKYDEGAVVFQEKCPVTKNDTDETIASKVRELEHKHFSRVIEGLILEI